MLPVTADPIGAVSSLATSERMPDSRAALALRTISELLRVSTKIDGAAAAVVPGAAPPPWLSVRRWISGAMSLATAYFSWMTSTSPPDGTSIAVMICAIRCRLSA